MMIDVKVIPGSSRNEIIKTSEGSYRVKLTVAPIGGKANEALLKLLAKELKIARSSLEIINGRNSKNKFIKIG